MKKQTEDKMIKYDGNILEDTQKAIEELLQRENFLNSVPEKIIELEEKISDLRNDMNKLVDSTEHLFDSSKEKLNLILEILNRETE